MCDAAVAMRPQVAQYTSDIHVLPSFLRLTDFPGYLKYLIDTRNIGTVLMSNSQLVYEILPAMVEQTPHVKWIDYVSYPPCVRCLDSVLQLHNEGFNDWKKDGFPTYALISRRYLSRTLTCSEHLRDWLLERSFPPDRVGVAKLGVNLTRFGLVDQAAKNLAKQTVLGLEPSTFVVAWSARLEDQKRPHLIPPIVSRALGLAQESCGTSSEDVRMFVMGNGYLKDGLVQSLQTAQLESVVHLMGAVADPVPILQASDVLLMPSAMEGLSIAVAEAMAVGLAIIASDVGGLPEELGGLSGQPQAEGGVLVNIEQSEDVQVEDFARALAIAICDREATAKLGFRAASYIRETFDQAETLRMFPRQFEAAHPPRLPAYDASSPVRTLQMSDVYLLWLAERGAILWSARHGPRGQPVRRASRHPVATAASVGKSGSLLEREMADG
jgi:glycosyltransferase involved in cell wall biosynthesis